MCSQQCDVATCTWLSRGQTVSRTTYLSLASHELAGASLYPHVSARPTTAAVRVRRTSVAACPITSLLCYCCAVGRMPYIVLRSTVTTELNMSASHIVLARRFQRPSPQHSNWSGRLPSRKVYGAGEAVQI